MPLLYRIADDCGDRFALAKVNTDEEPRVAAQFGIRSVPTVILFHGGRAVGQFAGVQPEASIRALLDKYLSPAGNADPEGAEALAALAASQLDRRDAAAAGWRASCTDWPAPVLLVRGERSIRGRKPNRGKFPGPAMAEKPESDEFEEEDDDVTGAEDSLDVDRLMQDLDKRKRGAARHVEEPAWRRLERMLEQKRTSELLSDFDDYDIGDGRPRRKG